MDLTKLSDEELLELKEKKTVQMNKHDLAQGAMKVALNSLYGCMGNQYFVFYATAMAEAITVTGQYFIRTVANYVNDWLQSITDKNDDYRLGGDTDSVFFNINTVIEKFMPDASFDEQLDKIVEFADTKMQEKIEETIKEICDSINAFEPGALKMAREMVCDAAILVAKKKYTFSIVDDEGNRLVNKKHKITGLESKKAIISSDIRDKLKEAYWVCLHNDDSELIKFVSDFKKEFENFDVDMIAQITGVNGIEEYVNKTKGVPYHVKAAISHNNYIKKIGIEDIVNPIQSGSKIKIINLKIPNPTMKELFAYEGDWKEEFGLCEYVDRNLQFEKSFKEPLKNLTEAIEYAIEPKQTYDIF